MAKILWTTNVVLPEAASLAGEKPVFSGGWLSGMLNAIRTDPTHEFHVCMLSKSRAPRKVRAGSVTYHWIPRLPSPSGDVDSELVTSILAEVNPDLVHIQGTEFKIHERFLKQWPGPNIVTIQGLMSGIEPFDLGGLSLWQLATSSGLRLPSLALRLLLERKFRLKPRVAVEKRILQHAEWIVGRTDWDHGLSSFLAPQAKYIHIGEILRSEFYNGRWTFDADRSPTILIGGASHPRKGAHFLIEALPLLAERFPDISVRVIGNQPARNRSWSLLPQANYAKYVLELAKSVGVAERIKFTGPLDATGVKREMLSASAYVMTSFIENSPNTLGEAMMLGLPCIVAFVGGAPSMADDKTEALFYRADEPAMLAHQVTRVLSDYAVAQQLSNSSAARARINHSYELNSTRLLDLYSKALLDSKHNRSRGH